MEELIQKFDILKRRVSDLSEGNYKKFINDLKKDDLFEIFNTILIIDSVSIYKTYDIIKIYAQIIKYIDSLHISRTFSYEFYNYRVYYALFEEKYVVENAFLIDYKSVCDTFSNVVDKTKFREMITYEFPEGSCYKAIVDDNIEIIKELDQNKSLNQYQFIESVYGRQIMEFITKNKNFSGINLVALAILLDSNKCYDYLINKSDAFRNLLSLIQIAIIKGRFDLFQTFISKTDIPLESFLQFSVQNYQNEIADYILDNTKIKLGISYFIDAFTYNNFYFVKKAIDRKLLKKKDESGRTPLFESARIGSYDVIKYVIDNDRSAADVRSLLSENLLHLSARNGHLKISEYLYDLDRGFMTEDATQQTPLHCAASNGFIEILKMFAKRRSGGWNKVDEEENTLLHVAAEKGSIECCNFVIDMGVDLKALNSAGKTAFDIAKEIHGKNSKIARFLYSLDV